MELLLIRDHLLLQQHLKLILIQIRLKEPLTIFLDQLMIFYGLLNYKRLLFQLME